MKMWTCTLPGLQGGRRRASRVGASQHFHIFSYLFHISRKMSIDYGSIPIATYKFPRGSFSNLAGLHCPGPMSAKERQDENGRHNSAKSPKEIPEASEEDWIERIKKRWDGVKNLESKEFYKLNQDISRSLGGL